MTISDGLRGFSSQIHHYQKYKSEYEEFLNRLNSEKLSAEETHALGKATKAFKQLDSSHPDHKALSSFLREMLFLHTSKLKREAQDPGAYKIDPLYLKRMERLDRLSEKKDPEVYKAIYAFATSSCVDVENIPEESNNTLSANPSHFLVHPQKEKKVGLFKPLNDQPSPFPSIHHHSVAQRQLGGYLISRKNGSVNDVPLSTLSVKKDELGSLQTFRKSRGELKDLPSKERIHIPTDTLQFAAVFRGRLFDLDGHFGNLLWKKKRGEIQLTHIDLDYILPSFSRDMQLPQLKIAWMFLPQMDEPFHPKVLEYLSELNVESEIEDLERLPVEIPPESLKLLEATTKTFQLGAQLGLTPGEIIDFLNSEPFKENFLNALEDGIEIDTFINATVQPELKTAKLVREDANKRINTLVEKIKKQPDSEDINSKIRMEIEDFIYDGTESWRYGVKLGRMAILAGISSEDSLKLIDCFQKFAKSNPTVMWFAIESLVDTLEASGKLEEADQVRAWLQNELSG